MSELGIGLDVRILMPARADRARHRRRHATAEAAVGHHRHQHEDRKHHGNARQRIGAEEADIVGLGDADRRLRHRDG